MSEGPHTAGPPRPQTQATLSVDLAALAGNWRLLRDAAAPAECAAVVKADAYGIGIEPAVRALFAAGCRTFFVAHLSEGARVRSVLGDNSDCAIYALNGLLLDDEVAAQMAAHDIRPVIGSMAELAFWIERARANARHLQIALQFNSGMNRLGIDCALAQRVRNMVAETGALERVQLVMSHFASSEAADDPLNARQIEAFTPVRALFGEHRASMANSSGIFLPHRPYFDVVRPGYALYGGNPLPGQNNPMKPVITLEAPVIQVRELETGETVGYNAQWTAHRRSRIAVIGVGYADGIPRAAMGSHEKSGAQAWIAGHLCPFAGRVSMDLITIDITEVPAGVVTPGTMAEILGPHIGVDDLAARANTIGYEILTSLGPRYHRVYRD